MTKTLKKGFTLVELIVVIAIIAILSTVSVVGYSAFMKNAKQSKVNQELAQAENVLRAEAVETVKVSLTDGENAPTLVMSLEGSQIKFKFTLFTTPEEEKQALMNDLVNELIKEVGLSTTLKGKFTLDSTEEPTKHKLKYTLEDDDDVFATLDVIVEGIS